MWARPRARGLDLGPQPSPGPPWGTPNRPPEIPGFPSQWHEGSEEMQEQFPSARSLRWEAKKVAERRGGQRSRRRAGRPGAGRPSPSDRRTDRRRAGFALRAVGSGQFLPSSDGADGHAGGLAGSLSLRLLLWGERHTRGPLRPRRWAGRPGWPPPPQWLTRAVSGHFKYIPHRNVCRILLLVAAF